ncbi:Os07g0551650, partial [Oryza sativa Japonica Group]
MDGDEPRRDRRARGHEQREERARPLAPPPHDPERERVEQHQDPHVEHQPRRRAGDLRRRPPPDDRLPRRRADGSHVHRHHHHRRRQQRRPVHVVQLREPLPRAAGQLLRRQLEPHALQSEEPLEHDVQHRRQVHPRGADHVELLVAPPVEQGEPRPLDLDQADHLDHGDDGDEVGDVRRERLLDVELAVVGEPDHREEVVDDHEQRRDRVRRHVGVRDALHGAQPAAGEERAVAGEEHLERAARPPQDLVEALREVDRRRAAERVGLHGAVHGPPPLPVQPEAGHHVLRRDVVHPPDAVAPFRPVLVRARHHLLHLRHGRRLVERRRRRRRDGPFLARRRRYRVDERHRVSIPAGAAQRLGVVVLRPPPRRVGAVERDAAEHAAGADVGRALDAVEAEQRGVEEDAVVVAVPVGRVDVVEALRELDECGVVAVAAVEHEAQGGAERLGVVDVVVAVEVEDEGRVRQQRGYAQLRVHGAGLLLVVVSRPLLPGDVDQYREAHVDGAEVQRVAGARRHAELRLFTRMAQHYLNDSGVLSFFVILCWLGPCPWPRGPICHQSGLRAFGVCIANTRFRSLRNVSEQRIEPRLELLVLPAHEPAVAEELLRQRRPGVRRRLRREVALGRPRLDAVLPAERDPQRGEPRRLDQPLVVGQRRAVVGEVGGVPVGGVVGGEDGQDGVHGVEHRLVDGVDGVDEHVDAGEAAVVEAPPEEG